MPIEMVINRQANNINTIGSLKNMTASIRNKLIILIARLRFFILDLDSKGVY